MATLNMTHELNRSSPYRCKFNEDFKYILLPVSYSLVFVVGLVLNVMAMYVMLFRIKCWKPSTIYMFNLTVCDTSYLFTLPFLIYYYADKNDWPFGEPLCKLIRFLFYTNLYGSILFLSCISLHRFLGICFPMHSLQWVSAHKARLISAAIWVTLVAFQAPILYFSRTRNQGTELVCYDTTSAELFDHFLIYSSVISVLLFCVPLAVVLVCYWLMAQRLLGTVAGMGGANSRRSKQKSVKMIIIVLAVFMLCFLPFHLTRSLYYSFRYLDKQVSCSLLENTSIAYKVMRPLASANSCLDPILYFLAGQGFRKNFTIKKKKTQLTRTVDAEHSSTTSI